MMTIAHAMTELPRPRFHAALALARLAAVLAPLALAAVALHAAL